MQKLLGCQLASQSIDIAQAARGAAEMVRQSLIKNMAPSVVQGVLLALALLLLHLQCCSVIVWS